MAKRGLLIIRPLITALRNSNTTLSCTDSFLYNAVSINLTESIGKFKFFLTLGKTCCSVYLKRPVKVVFHRSFKGYS